MLFYHLTAHFPFPSSAHTRKPLLKIPVLLQTLNFQLWICLCSPLCGLHCHSLITEFLPPSATLSSSCGFSLPFLRIWQINHISAADQMRETRAPHSGSVFVSGSSIDSRCLRTHISGISRSRGSVRGEIALRAERCEPTRESPSCAWKGSIFVS